MKFKKCLLPVAMLASFTLAGCQSNADDHAADVYQTDQLNTKQETKTVNIISILPAKVAVDKTLVEGVSLTYKEGTKVYTSTQVGKECQFTTGLAVVITTTYNETRIQPNTKCPEKS